MLENKQLLIHQIHPFSSLELVFCSNKHIFNDLIQKMYRGFQLTKIDPKLGLRKFKFQPKIFQKFISHAIYLTRFDYFRWKFSNSCLLMISKLPKCSQIFPNFYFWAKIISLDKPPYVYYGWIYSKTNVLFLGKQILQSRQTELRHAGAGINSNQVEFVWICSNLLEWNRLKLFLLVFR